MSKRFDSPAGPSQRQLKVGELVRRALSEVFLRGEFFDPDLDGVPLTVGECRPSPDMKHVTVFVSPLGGGDAETVAKALRRHQGFLRREVARRVRLKHAPELHFQPDQVYDRMDAAKRLLDDPHVRQSLEGDDDDA